jgi:hypothetical protein
MPKPIFLIGVTNDIRNEEQVHNIRKAIQRKIKDYHVLVYTSKTSEFDFKCFYEKDFDNVRFEELKEIVKQTINK